MTRPRTSVFIQVTPLQCPCRIRPGSDHCDVERTLDKQNGRHTAINERLDGQRWMELLREHNALVREQIQSHEGYEVKTEGDGFMVAFGSARMAVQCAIAIQRAFAKRNDDADEPVKEADGFYGKQVTEAAPIADTANAGEILVSALLKELTESAGDIEFGGGM